MKSMESQLGTKNVLIAGATGYLGSHIASALVLQGWHVIVVSRSARSKVNNENYTYFDADHMEDAFRKLGEISLVVNCVGQYSGLGVSSASLNSANVLFPTMLLRLALKYKVGSFLNLATSLAPDVNEYAQTKYEFLKLAESMLKGKLIKFINLKCAYVYGAGDQTEKLSSYVIASCLASAEEIKISNGDQEIDFLHVDDFTCAVMAIIKSINNIDYGFSEVGVGSGEMTSVRSFVELVRRITGSKSAIVVSRPTDRLVSLSSYRLDLSFLGSLNWKCEYLLVSGIRQVLKVEKSLLSL